MTTTTTTITINNGNDKDDNFASPSNKNHGSRRWTTMSIVVVLLISTIVAITVPLTTVLSNNNNNNKSSSSSFDDNDDVIDDDCPVIVSGIDPFYPPRSVCFNNYFENEDDYDYWDYDWDCDDNDDDSICFEDTTSPPETTKQWCRSIIDRLGFPRDQWWKWQSNWWKLKSDDDDDDTFFVSCEWQSLQFLIQEGLLASDAAANATAVAVTAVMSTDSENNNRVDADAEGLYLDHIEIWKRTSSDVLQRFSMALLHCSADVHTIRHQNDNEQDDNDNDGRFNDDINDDDGNITNINIMWVERNTTTTNFIGVHECDWNNHPSYKKGNNSHLRIRDIDTICNDNMEVVTLKIGDQQAASDNINVSSNSSGNEIKEEEGGYTLPSSIVFPALSSIDVSGNNITGLLDLQLFSYPYNPQQRHGDAGDVMTVFDVSDNNYRGYNTTAHGYTNYNAAVIYLYNLLEYGGFTELRFNDNHFDGITLGLLGIPTKCLIHHDGLLPDGYPNLTTTVHTINISRNFPLMERLASKDYPDGLLFELLCNATIVDIGSDGTSLTNRTMKILVDDEDQVRWFCPCCSSD